MSQNLEIYIDCFHRILSLQDVKEIETSAYQDTESWDSLAHMSLVAEIERAFKISLEMDEVIDFSNFHVGIELLRKHGIEI